MQLFVSLFHSFLASLHNLDTVPYIKIRHDTIPFCERPTIPRIDAASPYVITRIPTTLIDVNCSTLPCVVAFPHYIIAEKAGLLRMMHIDPIEVDIVSYTKIYGQDKLILTH